MPARAGSFFWRDLHCGKASVMFLLPLYWKLHESSCWSSNLWRWYRQDLIEKPDFRYSVPPFPHKFEISQLQRNPKMVFLSLPLTPRGNMSGLCWTLCVAFGILPCEVQPSSEAGGGGDPAGLRAKVPRDVDCKWARGTSLGPDQGDKDPQQALLTVDNPHIIEILALHGSWMKGKSTLLRDKNLRFWSQLCHFPSLVSTCLMCNGIESDQVTSGLLLALTFSCSGNVHDAWTAFNTHLLWAWRKQYRQMVSSKSTQSECRKH